jgi:3-oxoacid CoA-transferase subunit A
VYYEPEFPHIRYFLDYGFYEITGYSCLIIGGAYSVDKAWRLQRCMLTEETNDPKKSGWFNDEQLTPEEREDCMRQIKAFAATGKTVDFIMTHTCPYSVEPRDMFLNFIDQSTVDDSMEHWLDEVKDTIKWNIWLWAHFHDDRLERPHMEMYYNDIEELQTIVDRWTEYDETGELPWHIKKSPNFYTKD